MELYLFSVLAATMMFRFDAWIANKANITTKAFAPDVHH